MKSGMTKKLIKTARGEMPAELVFKNCSIVNVFSGEILQGEIAVTEGIIAAVSYYKDGDISYEGGEIIDLQGKIVFKKHFENAHLVESVSLDGLSKGMYLAIMQTSTKRITKKIIVE